MTDKADETLGRLTRVDTLCDRYEELRQSGIRLSPSEFLLRESVDTAEAPPELLEELGRLDASYRDPAAGADRAETAAFVPTAPRRVGRYELRRPLGAGGFGEVWVAFDPHLDREIAIKIPHKGVFENSAAVDRFYREAKAAAKLKHANIVQVHDAGSDGSTHFIAAELINGQTLKELCPADGMAIRSAVRIVADLAGAVFYAHRNQIIHRDIKPGNVLMDAAHHPHLTDFGLASHQNASALTTEGAILGTPIYMAPEQAAGRFAAALPACDQYSLGTVLYELLTGRPPFSGTNSVVLYHKLNTEPPHPRTIRPEIPPEVETICLRAMERIPEKRYPDCETMAVALRAWLGNATVARPRRFRRAAWAASGMLVAIAVAVAVAALRPTGKSNADVEPPVEKPVGNPAPVLFLDATAYLPLAENRRRKVLEFAEIHGVSPDALAKWIARLEPGYVPIFVSDHPMAKPSQWHGIAAKLDDPPDYRITDIVGGPQNEDAPRKALEVSGYRFGGGVSEGPPKNARALRFFVKDSLNWFHWVRPWEEQVKVTEEQRGAGAKPLFSLPTCADAPHLMEVFFGPAGGRTNWRADFNLAPDSLDEYANDVRQTGRYICDLRARKDENDQLRFVAFAWENPKGYDWDFKFDMTTREYEAELVRRKVEGFRPTTVTSYGDPADPKYAAAWIRYFDLPKQ